MKRPLECGNEDHRSNKKIKLRYNFNNNYNHYIDIERALVANEQETLSQLLQSFPHCNDRNWPDKFFLLSFEKFPKELLVIAANAYDGQGNTVLGVACEYGKQVEAVQRLIDMGADLNAPDHNMKKLALHWAINNKLSYYDKTSFEAVQVVKCLLDNGAKTNITCYQCVTPYIYAKSRGFIAAASLIEENTRKRAEVYTRVATIGLFKGIFPTEVSLIIASFLSIHDGARIAQTRKNIYYLAKEMGEARLVENLFLKDFNKGSCFTL